MPDTTYLKSQNSRPYMITPNLNAEFPEKLFDTK